MKIHIPNSAWLGNIDPFLDGFDPSDPERLDLTFHKKWMSVHPMVLAMIAALAVNIDPKQIHCETPQAKSKHYLDRMGLFQFLGLQSGMLITQHDASGRFVPLTQIKTAAELSRFIADVNPLLHLDPFHAEPIRYIMSELIRNVLEHSLSPQGAVVSAQYYKKSNVIRIGIVDTGIGIWQSINQSYNPKNDLDAIRLALTPGITGTTTKEGGTEQNAGAGLFFIKSIAVVNNDFFVVYSGNAMYKLLKQSLKHNTIKKPKKILHADPFDDRHSSRGDLPFWQGTAIGIDLSLDASQHEFSQLLRLFRETWHQAIRQRKRARYHKPQFI